MANQFLDKTGLTYLWGKIKAYVADQLSDISSEVGLRSTYDSVNKNVTITVGTSVTVVDNTEY